MTTTLDLDELERLEKAATPAGTVCPACKGSGEVRVASMYMPLTRSYSDVCVHCNGTGREDARNG